MTPGLPALKQVRLPAIQDAWAFCGAGRSRENRRVQVTAHGLPAHAHVLRDPTHAHAFLVEAHDLCVARQPPCTPLLAQPLVFCRRNYARLAGYLGCVALAQISRGGRDGYGRGRTPQPLLCRAPPAPLLAAAPYHRHGARSAKRYAYGSAGVATPRANWPANASDPPPYGVRRAAPCTFGVAAAATRLMILNTWMSLQPGRQCVGRAVSE